MSRRIMHLGGQLRLKLERLASPGDDSFIVSSSNRDAVDILDRWPQSESLTLALVGPQGSGKSRLARIWATRTQASAITPQELEADPESWTAGPRVLEDADQIAHGEGFFHLLNNATRPDCCLLLTGRTAPSRWAVEVPDLRSRLNALPVVELGEPDDEILRAVLIKFFEEAGIRPPADLLAYLLLRIERSVPAARAIVTALDEVASAEGRPMSRVLARHLLKDDTEDHESDAVA